MTASWGIEYSGEESDDGFDATVGEEDAEYSAGEAENDALGEELLDDAFGAGAHGGANGDFSTASAGAGEK